MDQFDFKFVNIPGDLPVSNGTRLSEYFTLTANPSTTIWQQPGQSTTASAPMILTHLQYPFVLAEVTVIAELDRAWDQGGLIIFSGPPPEYPLTLTNISRRRSSSRYELVEGERTESGKWVKAGLELNGNILHATTAVASKASGTDLSLSPLQNMPLSQPHDPFATNHTISMTIRFKFERIGDSLCVWYKALGDGHSNWLSHQEVSPETSNQDWRKIREVMGFFTSITRKQDVWVGCYASRPTSSMQDYPLDGRTLHHERLLVEFEDFEIF